MNRSGLNRQARLDDVPCSTPNCFLRDANPLMTSANRCLHARGLFDTLRRNLDVLLGVEGRCAIETDRLLVTQMRAELE
jgi:hypothetical protein